MVPLGFLQGKPKYNVANCMAVRRLSNIYKKIGCSCTDQT